MTVADIVERLDGWTRVRIDKYDEDTGDYKPVYTEEAFFSLPREYEDAEVEEIALENNHIVLRIEVDEEEE